jgi:tetratricopeptide (TPR) repeat protein
MKLKINILLFFFFGITIIPHLFYAQELSETPTDDLGNVSDAYQENFFEALKQRGIENHELALEALKKAEKAAKKDPKLEAPVFFEIGKNLISVRRYRDGEAYLRRVLDMEGQKLDVMEVLYDLYYEEKDYNSAIALVKELIVFDEDYKEDLANLYSRTRQYDKALEVLDELDESWGESDYRNALRTQIYRTTGNSTGEIEKLEERIDGNKKNEKDYLNLIFLYSEQDNPEKAYETAQELLKQYPNSKLVHLALYKFYLDEGKTQEALNSMDIVFETDDIDLTSKYRVLGDFIQFVNKNPQYEDKLENIVSQFSEENSGLVFEKLGDYYIEKERKEEALKFYEKGIVLDTDNFSLLKNTLLLQIDFKKFNEAKILSAKGLEIFPAQPLLYLLNGVANIGLQKPDAAIESLELGVDFVIDNPKMEKDFYIQLRDAYQQKGDTKKAANFDKKATAINLTN